jgi:hypothetical protein
MKMHGKVIRELYGKGSKSEHAAVMFATDQGTFRLRQTGGNPFQDPALDELVGREIDAEGVIHQGTFLMSSWGSADSGE